MAVASGSRAERGVPGVASAPRGSEHEADTAKGHGRTHGSPSTGHGAEFWCQHTKWRCVMRVSVSHGLPLVVLYSVALMEAFPGHAQTTPTTTAQSTAAAASSKSPGRPTQSEKLQWSALGAIAQCRDGTFFHDRPSARACADHGGVRKWLQGREQALIR